MNSNKKTLTAILILLVMCTGISISYAFFKVASSNNNANTNVTINGAALCMSLQLSSDNITISNEYAVPISDSKALSSDTYKTSVTITNNCNTSQSFNLLLVPNSSNTMPIKALKYALVEEGVTPTSGTLISNEYILDSTIQKQLLAIKNETLKNGFSVGSGTVSSGTKTYNLYLWIDKDEGSLGNGSTMNKSLNAYLTLGSGSVIGDLKLDLYHTIENRYNQDKTYLGLYNGEGADTYANPVYYYKGNVQNNNVLFAGFCWKIVRTTETGGVKIVYNGVQKDGSCNNTGTDSQIGKSTFNKDYNSPAYVGYMHNTVYPSPYKAINDSTYFSGTKAYGVSASYNLTNLTYTLTNAKTIDVSSSNISTLVGKYTCNSSSTTGTCSNLWYIVGYSGDYIYYYSLSGGDLDGTNKGQNYVFGSSFTYANGTYTLSDTKTINSNNWASQKSNVNTHHYTCLSSGTTCSSIYYVYEIDNGSSYYITLTNGKSVNDALIEMLYANDVNKNDSTIKNYIDKWYINNLKTYEDKLEDTVFCNDRRILYLDGWDPNGGDTMGFIAFNNYAHGASNKSLVCTNEIDSFSMSNSKAKLSYPIGLLSVPELTLAGYGSNHYFNNGQDVWLISPAYFISDHANVWLHSSRDFSNINVYYSLGVRPSVSLKPKTYFSSGDGSFTNPFVIGDAVEEPSGNSFDTVFAANNTDIFSENGLRYEGADPNNYICLDNKTSGACSDSSLLFRIIGLFDEDTSSDGTSSSGSKKLLKILDTNNYGGTSGKYWNQTQTSGKNYNDWSTATLKTDLNVTYLNTLLATSGVNSKLSSGIVNTKWHLGGGSSSNYQTLTADGIYKAERSPYATSGTLQNLYSGNLEYVFAKVGLIYPSDYGYATVGGSTTNRAGCRAKELYNWDDSSFSDCKNNDWLFTSQNNFVNSSEWFLSPCSSNSDNAAVLYSTGCVGLGNDSVSVYQFAVRPTFYLDSSILKIVGTGDGTKDNAYRVG